MDRLFGKVYQVVENPFEKDAGIEIISGEYKGLVYQYGKLQFVEGEPQINFERTIRRLPESTEPSEDAINELLNNSNLQELMGDILQEILKEQLSKEQINDEQGSTERTD
jgi:hypothetical protein